MLLPISEWWKCKAKQSLRRRSCSICLRWANIFHAIMQRMWIITRPFPISVRLICKCSTPIYCSIDGFIHHKLEQYNSLIKSKSMGKFTVNFFWRGNTTMSLPRAWKHVKSNSYNGFIIIWIVLIFYARLVKCMLASLLSCLLMAVSPVIYCLLEHNFHSHNVEWEDAVQILCRNNGRPMKRTDTIKIEINSARKIFEHRSCTFRTCQ